MNGIYTLLALLFLGIDSKAQIILPEKEGYIFYEVIDSAGGTKNDLFAEAKKWLVSYNKKTREVIKEEDREAGQILGKGNLSYDLSSGSNAAIDMNFRITVKDNRFRIQAYDFQGYFLAGKGSENESRTPINLYTDLELYKKGKANKMIMELIEGLNEQMDLLLKDFRSVMKNNKNDKETATTVIK